MRVADIVAQTLASAGVTHAFGMPGGEILIAVDALERAGIRFVLARNETAAAIMAAGAHWTTGAPGLLVTTLGPGLANAVNGIADAWQERVPLIVLSAVVERRLRARYTHQIVDQAALLRPVVKASFGIEAEGAGAVVRRALAVALAGPCGPVHLDLSPDVAAAEAAPDETGILFTPAIPAMGADPASEAMALLRQRVARADRPLVVAGLEAVRSGAGDVLRSIAERHGVPVVTTYKAKGLLDETHATSLGAAGLSPLADSILLPLLKAADLVILAGYDPIEMRPGWLDAVRPEVTVELSSLPQDHGMHAAGLRLAGPVAGLLEAAFDGTPVRASWQGGEPEHARRRLADAFAVRGGFGPHELVATLAEILPPHALLTTDSGAHRILLSQAWRCTRPLSLLQSSGWCTMGTAIPLALGAAVAGAPGPVVAVLGDGGFEMTAGELATLRDQGVPVVVVVLQDESLGLIALKQEQAGLPSAGTAMGATDIAMCARAFGGSGATVSTSEDLADALRSALSRDGFSVIACRIRAGAYAGAL
jgi:acetolactate synthase-1/2/3 large subunit